MQELLQKLYDDNDDPDGFAAMITVHTGVLPGGIVKPGPIAGTWEVHAQMQQGQEIQEVRVIFLASTVTMIMQEVKTHIIKPPTQIFPV